MDKNDMGAFYFFLAVVLCALIVGLTNWWDNRKERESVADMDDLSYGMLFAEKDTEHKERKPMENQKGTRELFLETLTKIGCQYEFSEEENDDRIFFAYQGEHFIVDASNEYRYVQIWDTHWGHVELYDIDDVSRLKRAVNGANLNNSVITVYTIDEEKQSVDVHCKSLILFISQIPEIDNYLRLELSEFFRAHQFVGNEMARLRDKEQSK